MRPRITRDRNGLKKSLKSEYDSIILMRPPIKDEFSKLNVSKQRKYQLRKARDKRCHLCGQPSAGKTFCLKHMVERRERQRKLRGNKRRNNSLSYRLEWGLV